MGGYWPAHLPAAVLHAAKSGEQKPSVTVVKVESWWACCPLTQAKILGVQLGGGSAIQTRDNVGEVGFYYYVCRPGTFKLFVT